MIIAYGKSLKSRPPHDQVQQTECRLHRDTILATLDPAHEYRVTIGMIGGAKWLFAVNANHQVARCLVPEGGAA